MIVPVRLRAVHSSPGRVRWALFLTALACAALFGAETGRAQSWPGQSAPASRGNPMCARLENQLSALDRNADAGGGEQARRFEEAANRQQAELDRLTAQARRAGCEGSGFFLFSRQPPQCDALNAQIQRMRANLDRMNMDLYRMQRGAPDTGEQRRAILIALAQNDCGAQYRAAAPQRPRGLFESLFGAPSVNDYGTAESAQSSTYRTICVRTCDGFYFPISFSTTQNRFQEDEITCQRMCPNTEALLYAHRNPGEEVAQAVSIGGSVYRDLPNAFRYRTEFNASCSCRRAGQSWADALGQQDNTVERGDIVVTDERAKAMSQPRPEPGKSGRQDTRTRKGAKAAPPAPAPTAESAPVQENTTAAPDPATQKKGPVRTVGPTYFPTR